MPVAEAPHEKTTAEIVTADTAASETLTSPSEVHPHEPSPYVEAVADEPASSAAEEPPAAQETLNPTLNPTSNPPPSAPPPVTAPLKIDDSLPNTRRQPLRFMWQMDSDGRFSLGSDEFTRLIGAHTAAGFGRPWREIVETFGLDPEGRVVKAIATRGTWSGITLNWPSDGDDRLPVELSGLPIYDHTGNLTGYRGFGICRDLDGLMRLDQLRRHELRNGSPTQQSVSSGAVEADAPVQEPLVQESPVQESPAQDSLAQDVPVADLAAAEPPTLSEVTASAAAPEPSAPITLETSPPTDLETSVDKPQEMLNEMLKNVVPFRPISDPKLPVLTPVENNAFNELARQLSARLDSENLTSATAIESSPPEAVTEPPAASETPEMTSEQPGWLARAEPPARGETRRDKMLLDLLPVGILIYRLGPAAVYQSGVSHAHGLCEPACAGTGRRP